MIVLAFVAGCVIGALAMAMYMQAKCHKADTQAEVLKAQIEQERKAHGEVAVSYTHLTLPTICSV